MAITQTQLEDTQDWIFALSQEELEGLMPERLERVIEPTTYVYRQSAGIERNGVAWWLRDTQEDNVYNGYAVKANGSISVRDKNSMLAAARPALWLDLTQVTLGEDGVFIAQEPPDAQAQSEINIGDSIEFGRYEQNNDLTDGLEPIVWTVIAIQDGKAMLLSDYALEVMAFDEDGKKAIWETCSLRAWMNGEFYETAFNENEKARVVQMINTNPVRHNGLFGEETPDWAFVLSYEEIDRYLPELEQRRAQSTLYAKAKGALAGWTHWMLRSSSYNPYQEMLMDELGNYDNWRAETYYDLCEVRPAIWIDISGMDHED